MLISAIYYLNQHFSLNLGLCQQWLFGIFFFLFITVITASTKYVIYTHHHISSGYIFFITEYLHFNICGMTLTTV